MEKLEKEFKIGTNVKLLIQAEDLVHSDRSKLKFKIVDKRFSALTLHTL